MRIASTTGNVLINTTTDSGGKLTVKGSGTTSSTTALLVQNANTSSSLLIRDGVSLAGNNNTANIKVLIDESSFYGNYVYPGLNGKTYSLGLGGNLVLGATGTTSLSSSFLDFNVGYHDDGQGPQQPRGAFITATGTKTGGNTLEGRLVLGTYYNFDGSQCTGSAALYIYSGSVGIKTPNPTATLDVSGSITVSNILTLTPQSPLPSGVPTGSFAVSSSAPPKPYFYDGTTWNALY
jgi:hypothetical protein